jgi:hypothetical protein
MPQRTSSTKLNGRHSGGWSTSVNGAVWNPVAMVEYGRARVPHNHNTSEVQTGEGQSVERMSAVWISAKTARHGYFTIGRCYTTVIYGTFASPNVHHFFSKPASDGQNNDKSGRLLAVWMNGQAGKVMTRVWDAR